VFWYSTAVGAHVAGALPLALHIGGLPMALHMSGNEFLIFYLYTVSFYELQITKIKEHKQSQLKV
jgi:hypothetical protein